MPVIDALCGYQENRIKMKFVEHFEKDKLSSHNISKTWRGIMLQTIAFVIFFIILNQINYFTKSLPQYGVYTFYIGLFSIIPSIFLIFRYQSIRSAILKTFKVNRNFVLLGKDAEKLRRCMTSGFIFADLTLLCGVAHLVVTGSLLETSFLWGITLALCLYYKPCVNYINCSSNKHTSSSTDQ